MRISSRQHKSRLLRRLRKYRRGLIVAAIIAIGVAGGLVWYTMQADAAYHKSVLAIQNATDETAKLSKQNAEKRAKAEAERIAAAQRAAAQKAAEDAKTGSTNIQPDASVCNASKTHADSTSIDVVVNKKHCLQPRNYAPADLVTANGATLSAKAMSAYKTLFAAAAAVGQPFSVTSSYRSYNDQVSTYAYWVSVSGASGADTYSARPGYSEHQTGYAFDVAAGGCALDCFGTTSQYQWMQQHAAEYGFIQRYYAGYESITGYKAEEWHYRYVGVDVAQDMKAKGIKTLEQYWSIPGGDY